MRNDGTVTFVVLAMTGMVIAGTGFAGEADDDCGHIENQERVAEQGNHEHADGNGNHGHAGEDGNGEHGAAFVSLTEKQIKLAGITAAPATLGEVNVELPLNGQVTLNQDRLAHVLSPVPGVLREVRSRLGDRVSANEVMAVIESRELADAKAAYLAARERLRLAETLFAREERLWKKNISSEQEYLDARQRFVEGRIEQQSAEHKLHALGFSNGDLQSLIDHPDESFSHYPVVALFDGTVIEKHITAGEQVDQNSPLFSLANLQNVWVIANVYEQDIASVELGQLATITVGAYAERTFQGKVGWIADIIDENTRTLKVRIEADNRDRLLKPGMFARIALGVAAKRNVLTIPPAALQTQNGEAIVFVDEGDGCFERREVKIGIGTANAIEVLDGILDGELVVTSGSYILKSELEKVGLEAGHAH